MLNQSELFCFLESIWMTCLGRDGLPVAIISLSIPVNKEKFTIHCFLVICVLNQRGLFYFLSMNSAWMICLHLGGKINDLLSFSMFASRRHIYNSLFIIQIHT